MAEWMRRPIRGVLRRAPWQVVTRLWQREGPVLAELVGPLRLDVLVIRDFLRFYLKRRDLAASRFEAFVDDARGHRFWDLIYGWFSLYHPEVVRDAGILRTRFTEQVRRSVMLWHQVADGYDVRQPVEIKVAARVLPTTTGKTTVSRYGLGDGSHRAACLMVLGHRALPVRAFYYRWYRTRRPYDGTWVLTHRKALRPAEYFRYLSEVYGSTEPFATGAALRRFVKAVRPERLDELHSVVRADGYDAD
ncbi:MAG: hypothetical protein QN178_08140 [Armatimonadota bacterium]|nr:hypothetical protein [Armatimonadota bacterium]